MTPALHVYVYKEGFLARFGHDLRVSVTRFEVTLRGDRVTASFDVGSVRVDGAATGDQVDASAISDADKLAIRGRITDEILHAAQHPTVTVEGALSWADPLGPALRARITMNGRAVDEEIPIGRIPGVLRVNTVIVPSRWGIAPYRTLAGAIRLQDRWRIQLYLGWALALDALRGAETTWVAKG
ncbi:MAG: hypothetical protein Q8P18_17450 [Pseudomonadota bacterium]|nr:hypothetical protein [Pseudomonadota bacterium]